MLFDKNGFYMMPSKLDGYDFAVDIINGNFDRPNIYGLQEALKRGNLYPNLYDKYDGYEPRELKVSTEREKKLLKIQELDFSIGDLNLYLDLNPNDTAAFKTFKCYVEEYRKLVSEYTKIFGPLYLDGMTDEYEWSKGVWPWEEGGM